MSSMMSTKVMLPRAVHAVRARAVAVRAGGDPFNQRPEQGPGRFEDLTSGRGLDLGRGIELAGPGDSTGAEFGAPSGAPEQDPTNYDPEGLFSGATTLQDGHIERRAAYHNLADGEKMEEAVARQKEAFEQEAQARRDATVVPSNPAKMVEFLLNLEATDMEYFVAKGREQLGPEFFTALDSKIGEERFLPDPDEDLLADLEALRLYVNQIVEAQDTVKTGVVAATEKLRALLTSQDKKAFILDLASRNEIDPALMSLLQQNIDGAAAAGQEQASEFMCKVRDACAKYVIIPEKQTEEGRARAAVLAQQQGQTAPAADAPAEKKTAGGLIMP